MLPSPSKAAGSDSADVMPFSYGKCLLVMESTFWLWKVPFSVVMESAFFSGYGKRLLERAFWLWKVPFGKCLLVMESAFLLWTIESDFWKVPFGYGKCLLVMKSAFWLWKTPVK